MNEKNKRKNDPRLEGTMPNTGTFASSTDFTGLIPAAGADSEVVMDEMYEQLFGIPDPVLGNAENSDGKTGK